MTSQLKDVHFANIGVCSGVDGGMRMIDSAEYLSLPQGCRTLSVCEGATIAFDDGKGESAGFQFIPEAHDVEASEIIGNFLWNVLHLEPNYNCESFIEQTVREKLPEGFQRAEMLLEKGAVDMIVDRRELRPVIAELVALLGKKATPAA